MKVRLTPAAQRDFAAQVAWLKDRSPSAGRHAAKAIVEALDTLQTYPDIGPTIDMDHREKYVRFGGYGFVITYERRDSFILVTRIYHGAQDRPRR